MDIFENAWILARLSALEARLGDLDDDYPEPQPGGGGDEGGGLDLTKASFGYEINPDGDNLAEVKIYDGQIITDNTAREPVVVTHIPFIISGTQTVYVQADTRDVAGTAELTLTHSESLYYRYYRLYEFTVAAGKIDDSLTKIYRPFDIESGFDQSDIPDGTEANPHLIWNPVAGEWVIGVIVPDGSIDYPHLVWNPVTEIWEADKLFTLPDGGDTYIDALWNPVEGEWQAVEIFTGLAEGVATSFVTDVQFANNLFQKKTRTLTKTNGVTVVSAESEWTTITGGTAETCP